MSAAMQYSNPPVMLLGIVAVPPPGGREVRRDGELAGVGQHDVTERPLVTVISQSPNATAAPAGVLLLDPLSSPQATAANTSTKANRPADSLRTCALLSAG